MANKQNEKAVQRKSLGAILTDLWMYIRLMSKMIAGALPKIKIPTIKPKAKLIRVVSITSGKHHTWCDSDQGLIRKPISAIPKRLLKEKI